MLRKDDPGEDSTGNDRDSKIFVDDESQDDPQDDDPKDDDPQDDESRDDPHDVDDESQDDTDPHEDELVPNDGEDQLESELEKLSLSELWGEYDP